MNTHPSQHLLGEFPRLIVSASTGVFLTVLLLLITVSSGAESNPKEMQLKAAFLYNFSKYVDWPPQSLPETTSPIVIGVIGNSGLASALEATVSGRKANGRAIIVKALGGFGGAKGVQILFVAASEDPHFGEIRELLGPGVLTVGETDAFSRQHGMITFTPDGDRLGFDINIGAANQAGLKISAQLQKLAKAVRKTP